MKSRATWSATVCLSLLVATYPIHAQYRVDDATIAIFGGPAIKTGTPSRPFEMGLGGGASLFHPRYGSIGLGPLAEGGFFHPALSGKGNYFASVDARTVSLAARASLAKLSDPFVVVGYTRFFNATSSSLATSNAVNAGLGVERQLPNDLRLRLELRQYYTPASGSHPLVFRISLVATASLE